MNKKRKNLSWWIAHVTAGGLDPMVVLPLMLAWLGWKFYNNVPNFWSLTLGLSVVDLLIPGMYFFWLWSTKQINDMDVSKWRLRGKLYVMFLICHLIGVGMVALWGNQFMLAVMMILWLILLLFWRVNLRMKVSVHVGVNSTWVSLLCWLQDWRFIIFFGLVFLVAWARVYQKHHSLQQVIAGGLIPVFMVSLGFLLFG